MYWQLGPLLILFTCTFTGCGPHHVEPMQISVTKYRCVNWFQTLAICDAEEICNDICKAERTK